MDSALDLFSGKTEGDLIMDRTELIKYWQETSDKDFDTMLNLYSSKDFHWALFIGHIVLEKLLKACYVHYVDNKVPFTHDLLRIAKAAGLTLNDDIANDLDFITTFNISTRYPDYKQAFYIKCNYEFAELNIKKIERIRIWLKNILSESL